jgi:O-antigen/teichoic acid export membrane protein
MCLRQGDRRNVLLMAASDDILTSKEAGGRIIRGSAMRAAANAGGILVGLGTAALLLRYLGVEESGRYVTVMSLVAIAGSITDNGPNITASRTLALREKSSRPALLANLTAQRMLTTPIVLGLFVLFTVLAGYPQRMVSGTVLAGAGLYMVSVADAVLLSLTVELRNAWLALVDFLKQAITLLGVAALVVLGAHLAPFFAVQIVVGVVVVILASVLVSPRPFLAPRLDRAEQVALLTRALPVATVFVLGQVYFRMVIVLMSLIASAKQTGYFGGSLRAMEAMVNVPILVAGVALPMLAAAARNDRARLRYAVRGMSEGAVVAGVFVILVTARAAEPVMTLIGGPSFEPSGAVLRIQVAALLFIALYQIWTVAIVALGRQRDLIFTNLAGLIGVLLFASVLVPLLGARGGAIASVLGDMLLAALIYSRLRAAMGGIGVRVGFLLRVLAAAALGSVCLVLPDLPGFVAAALAGVVFIVVGHAIGMLPDELRSAFNWRRLRLRAGSL